MEISSAKSHEIGATNTSGARTVYNRNYLLSSRSTQAYYNPVCYGMNAGNSGERGGWSVITLAKDEGADYICIVMGGTENEETGEIYAYQTANKLINWACKTYNLYKVYAKGHVIGQAEVGMTAIGKAKVNYATMDELQIYIPTNSNSEITYRIEYTAGKLVAPIKAGEKIGVVKVYSGGELVGVCDIALVEDCEANSVMLIIAKIGDYTKSRAFIITLIVFVILLPIVLIVKSRGSRARSKYRRY